MEMRDGVIKIIVLNGFQMVLIGTDVFYAELEDVN